MREKSIRDAANAQHRSTIHWAVGSLDIWLQLGTERREKLEKLLIAEDSSAPEVWRIRLLRPAVSGLEASGERAQAAV